MAGSALNGRFTPLFLSGGTGNRRSNQLFHPPSPKPQEIMTIRQKTLPAATEAFIKAVESDLIDADLPAVSQLRVIAAQIDTDPSVSGLHAQYGLIYRDLVKRLEARNAPEAVDPLERELGQLLTS